MVRFITARCWFTLFKGDNVITLGQYTKEGQDNSESAFSPVLDCFTLDLVDYPAMSEANRKGTIYPVALSDVAAWSSDFDDNIFADHNEYTESVAEANEATVTAQFPWPVLVSGYAFATTNDASAWTVEISADGENWKNAGEINKTATVGRVTTVTLNSPYADMEGNAARYVRLSSRRMSNLPLLENSWCSVIRMHRLNAMCHRGACTEFHQF